MKPHPKLRKTIKWGGAVVTVLLVVVWVASGWWTLGWDSGQNIAVAVNEGRFVVSWDEGHVWQSVKGVALGRKPVGGPLSNLGFFRYRHRWTMDGRFQSFRLGSAGGRSLYLPVWSGLILCVSAVCMPFVGVRLNRAVRVRFRVLRGKCPSCNYDRTGLAKDAKCPECGSSPS